MNIFTQNFEANETAIVPEENWSKGTRFSGSPALKYHFARNTLISEFYFGIFPFHANRNRFLRNLWSIGNRPWFSFTWSLIFMFFKPKLQILFGPQFWEDLFRIEVGLPLRHGKTKNWNIDDNNNFYNLSWLWQLVSYMLKRYFQLKFKRKLLRNICCNIENHCRMFLKIIIIKRETIVILFKKFEYFVFIWSASKAVFYIKQCIWSFVV